MIKEFALLPDLFLQGALDSGNAEGLRALIERIEENGLIGALNGNVWVNQILAACDSTEMRKVNMLSLLGRMRKHNKIGFRSSIAPLHPKNDNEWIMLAINSHHTQGKFDGIITDHWSKISDPAIIPFSKIHYSRKWTFKKKRSCTVMKCEENYRKYLSTMLRYAKKIHLIDPFFNCNRPEYKKTIEIIGELLTCLPNKSIIEVNIHAGNPNKDNQYHSTVEDRKIAWEKYINTELRFKFPCHFFINFWDKLENEKPHDRFIISEQYGVMIGYGLDCYEKGKAGSTTWAILDEDDRVKRLKKFTRTTPEFKLLDRVDIA